MSALLGVPWPVNSVGVLPEVRRGVLESRSTRSTMGGSGEEEEASRGSGVGGYLDLGEAGLAGVGWTNAKVCDFCWCRRSMSSPVKKEEGGVC